MPRDAGPFALITVWSSSVIRRPRAAPSRREPPPGTVRPGGGGWQLPKIFHFRTGITYEKVAAAADALVAQREGATVRAVRAAIGGSPNTILGHLQTWRGHQPQPIAAPVREMPAAIQRAWHEEALRIAAEARAETEARLVEAATDSADMKRRADELEVERDELLERIEALTRERDTLAGKDEVQTRELEEGRAELERERRAAEEGRVAVARERLASEGLRTELEALRKRPRHSVRSCKSSTQRAHPGRARSSRPTGLERGAARAPQRSTGT